MLWACEFQDRRFHISVTGIEVQGAWEGWVAAWLLRQWQGQCSSLYSCVYERGGGQGGAFNARLHSEPRYQDPKVWNSSRWKWQSEWGGVLWSRLILRTVLIKMWLGILKI
jgi:hypothetical protein